MKKELSFIIQLSKIMQKTENLKKELYLNLEKSFIKKTSALFELSATLNPQSYHIWYQIGKIAFQYAKKKKEKYLFNISIKSLKKAEKLNKNDFKIFKLLGNIFNYLGEKTKKKHFFFLSSKKYEQAISLTKNKNNLFSLYLEYAKILLKIAEEPIDIKNSIYFYKKAISIGRNSKRLFYNYSQALMKMAYLTNENAIYLEAIKYLKKILKIYPKNPLKIYYNIATCYNKLYLNTLSNSFFTKSDFFYKKTCALNKKIALEWATLLSFYGKITKNSKKLERSIFILELFKKNKKIFSKLIESKALLGAFSNNPTLINDAYKTIKKRNLWYASGMCDVAYYLYYDDINFLYSAIKKFKKVKDDNAIHNIAYCYYEIGKYLQDIKTLNKSLKYFTKKINLTPIYLYNFSNLLLKIFEITEEKKFLNYSIFSIEKIIKNPKDSLLNHPEFLFLYGKILTILGEKKEEEKFYIQAIDIFKKIKIIDPNFEKIDYKIALSYSHLGEYTFSKYHLEEGIKYFELALEKNKEDDEIYLEYGILLIFLSELHYNPKEYYMKSEKLLLRSCKLGNEQVYYHLACLYSILEKYDLSLKFLIKAKKQQVLPEKNDILTDQWLENLRSTKAFVDFISNLDNS
ncbi:MAG: hypothetical protein AMS24_05110 [Chlamydiae bacterium SM23_39]|nr:MAG: hypothetical protein AMS24_05110 [Chlamydiae bacterium SM23_39]